MTFGAGTMRLLLFILLNVLMVPIFVIGFGCYMLPILLVRGRVSGTAYEPFNGRLMYHLVGGRPDAAALQLAQGLPATNRGVMHLPIAWASRVTGYHPLMAQYPPPRPTPLSAMMGARCEFLDQAMRDHASAGDQVVILSAGWDTRAYGLLDGLGTAVLEVDAPATQAVKRAAIEKTGIDASHLRSLGGGRDVSGGTRDPEHPAHGVDAAAATRLGDAAGRDASAARMVTVFRSVS